jgi:predicted transcriptional regulator
MGISEVLTKAVVESIVFAEQGDEDSLDPDVAVRHEEDLASILLELTPAEREIFKKLVKAIADEEEKEYGPSQRVSFIRSIPRAVGFVD